MSRAEQLCSDKTALMKSGSIKVIITSEATLENSNALSGLKASEDKSEYGRKKMGAVRERQSRKIFLKPKNSHEDNLRKRKEKCDAREEFELSALK